MKVQKTSMTLLAKASRIRHPHTLFLYERGVRACCSRGRAEGRKGVFKAGFTKAGVPFGGGLPRARRRGHGRRRRRYVRSRRRSMNTGRKKRIHSSGVCEEGWLAGYCYFYNNSEQLYWGEGESFVVVVHNIDALLNYENS